MFLNLRLWQLTQGVRLRIFFAVLVGVISSTVGVVRLALLGWLLALIFQGAGFDDILMPAIIIAGVMVLRGALDHLRIMVAHETAARVQLLLRKRLILLSFVLIALSTISGKTPLNRAKNFSGQPTNFRALLLRINVINSFATNSGESLAFPNDLFISSTMSLLIFVCVALGAK